MFHSSVAFLPTSFCMFMTMLSFSFWYRGRTFAAMMCGAAAVLFGWPFVALVFVPVGIDAIARQRYHQIAWCIFMGLIAFIILPSVVDSMYYGKPVSALLNIVKYNALGMGGGRDGANLYGTEPWNFYIKNLALNFNLHMVTSLLSLPLVCVLCVCSSAVRSEWRCPPKMIALYLLPLYLVFGMFTSMAHKEERFLFSIYPLICLGSALSCTSLCAVVGAWSAR